MKKEEFIKRYGEGAYEKRLEQTRQWEEANPDKVLEQIHKWREANPEKVEAQNHERNRKGGRHYVKKLKYMTTGLQGERNKIRVNHAYKWRPYKNIIAPDSQIHHEWLPGSAEYRGVALVEKDQHMHGFVDVIKILNGKITLLTEEEVKEDLAENVKFSLV